ncbi:MAG: class I SAM-dependent methyltransferase [Myxococcota bacterium]|nr:class I SAM-dependent methyltransferase [Myxococcota bacterium]
MLEFRSGLTLPAMLCRSCQHRWLTTTPEIQHRIERAYGKHYTGFRIDERFKAVVAGELEHRLKRVKPPPGPMLDVGCGNGEFLALAVAAGYLAQGIDVSPTSSELCRSKGLSAVAGDFLSHDFGTRFGLITMWDVMEHLREPAEFVRRAYSLLDDSGVLVLKIPSKGALNFRLLRTFPRRGGTLLGAPNHIQFFTRRSLAKLLARAGFVEMMWLAHMRFRVRPKTRNLGKLIARGVSRAVAAAAADENLYVLANKLPFTPEIVASVTHRDIERLAP